MKKRLFIIFPFRRILLLTAMTYLSQGHESLIRRPKGDAALLFCNERNFTKWKKDNQPFNTENEIGVSIEAKKHYTILRFHNLTAYNAGMYRCRNTLFKIEVYDRLVLEAKPNKIAVDQKTKARLICRFTNRNKLRGLLYVQWHFNGQRISSSNRYTLLWDETRSESSLIVHDVRSNDAGKYKCNGGPLDNLAEASDTFTLKVNGFKPRFEEPLPHVMERYVGASVTLVCHAVGLPPPTFTWRKRSKNQVIGSERELIISNATEQASGTYACIASNKHGNATVEGKLLFKGINDDKEVVNLTDPNRMPNQIMAFELEYNQHQHKNVEVLCFQKEDGQIRKTVFPAIQLSKFAYIISFDVVSFQQSGQYIFIVREKETKYVLQENVKALEINGAPEAVSDVESSYNCSHLFAVVSMPTNKTYRPFYGVRATLWTYNLSPIASSKLIKKVNTVNGNITILSNFCQNDSGKKSALALELITYGPYGESEPWVVTPRRISTNATRDSLETLYFPTTDVLLTANVLEFHYCAVHVQESQRKFNSKEIDLAYSYFMTSHVIGAMADELKKHSVLIDLRNSYSTKDAVVLRINFATISLPAAVETFQKFLEETKRLRQMQADWCKVSINYKCILNHCMEFENRPTEILPVSSVDFSSISQNLAVASTSSAIPMTEDITLMSTSNGRATGIQSNLFYGFFFILLVAY